MDPSASPCPTDDEEETQGRCLSLVAEVLRRRSEKGVDGTEENSGEGEAAAANEPAVDRNLCSLDQIETGSNISDREVNHERTQRLREVRDVYFGARPQPKSGLIIDDFKEQILAAVKANEVVILTGPTGSGKSTQVPQYFLEESVLNLKNCNIVATQPRRVAAISIARRICESRKWELGKLCGFKVGLKDRTSPDTLLTVMTTGLLLQTLITRRSLSQYTHIILDEIHERDQSMDFLLIVIKKLLNENPNTSTKIILMSATVDAQRFASYFPKSVGDELIPCPILAIDRPTKYKVDIHYLDDFSDFGPVPEINAENPNISELAYSLCTRLIKEFEILEKDDEHKHSVLIFLPGIYEIEHLYNKLSDPATRTHRGSQYKWLILPLHSSITSEEQIEIFLPSKPGWRKIILSTNIAESSITVPGVKYVIDFCLLKRMKNDPSTNFNALQLCWASQANCIQRAGRVGRLMDGTVYRMIYKKFYESLDQECKPEILEEPLDRIVLQTKMLNMGEPKAILALALDPPDLSDLEWTILTLKEVGGLLRYRRGVYTPFDGDITFLGCLMAVLPVDIRITKLIAMGHIFGCLTDCIIMGAAMNMKNVFYYPFRDRLKAYESKINWAENTFSDCIALLNVYNIWNHHRVSGYFKRSTGENEIQWANRHFVRLRVLKETKLLVEEIKFRLKEYNLEDLSGEENTFNNDYERILFLKVAIAGAFFPQYFSPGYHFREACDEQAAKELGEQNPLTTLVLHGFPSDQPMELYFDMIKKHLSYLGDLRLHPQRCSKILIEFRRWEFRMRLHGETNFDVMPGDKIPFEVYRAIKTRHLRKTINIKLMPSYEAKIKAENLGLACWNGNATGNQVNMDNFPTCPLPSIAAALVHVVVTHVVDPGHFWASYASTWRTQEEVLAKIQNQFSECNPFERMPTLGEMCIAPLCRGKEINYHRARIESVEMGPLPSARVFFVDRGCYSELKICDLRQYGQDLVSELKDIPAQAFECVLKGIRPSSEMNVGGVWTKAATDLFKTLIGKGRLYGQIYSVVRGVVSMELHNIDLLKDISNINEFLVLEKHAERVPESHLSRMDHKLRAGAAHIGYQSSSPVDMNKKRFWTSGKPIHLNEEELTESVTLRGPTSPLEMTLYPSTCCTLGKSVTVAEDSVNSVLLNTEPTERHDRLIVAGIVNHNPDSTKLIINQTTVMPNIRGLPALIHLMFSPEVEIRMNRKRTMYTGMLCGLGADYEGHPLFPEHDMDIRFDSHITFADFMEVNSLRSLMSVLLKIGEQEYYLTRSDVKEYQKKIRAIVLGLLTKKRHPIYVVPGSGNYDWGRAPSSDSPATCPGSELVTMYCTYPPHSIQPLCGQGPANN